MIDFTTAIDASVISRPDYSLSFSLQRHEHQINIKLRIQQRNGDDFFFKQTYIYTYWNFYGNTTEIQILLGVPLVDMQLNNKFKNTSVFLFSVLFYLSNFLCCFFKFILENKNTQFSLYLPRIIKIVEYIRFGTRVIDLKLRVNSNIQIQELTSEY